MPNWKKVIVSGSDATLSDVTIDGWGSVSASLASINATGSSQNLQQVTDNGSTTTNSISINSSTNDSNTITINAGNGIGLGGDTILAGGYKTVNTEKKSSFVEDNDLGVTDLYKTSYKLSDNTITSIPDGKYFYQAQYQYRDGTGANDFAYGFKFLGQRGSSGGDTSNEASIFTLGISTNSGTWNNQVFRVYGNELISGGLGYVRMTNPILNDIFVSSSTQAIQARSYLNTQTLKSAYNEDPYDGGSTTTLEVGTYQFAVSSSYIDLPNIEENPSGNSFRILVGGHDVGQGGGHFTGTRGSGLVKYITSQSLFEGTGIVSGSTAQNLQEVTDQGSTTTNSITISGSSADLTLTGGSTIETDHTTILSAKQTIPDNNITTVFSVSVSTYVGAVIDYTFYDADRNNMRTGVVTAVANATATRHSELVTTDIGNTDALGVLVVLTGAGFGMRVSNETGTSFTAVCNIKLLKE